MTTISSRSSTWSFSSSFPPLSLSLPPLPPRQIYREEREANNAAFEEKQKERLKQVKLRLVLDCRWDDAVSIKQPSSPPVWTPAFLVIQVRSATLLCLLLTLLSSAGASLGLVGNGE
jgi:hypothetical protein